MRLDAETICERSAFDVGIIEYSKRSIDPRHSNAHYDNESENYATPSIPPSVHFLQSEFHLKCT